ncbi:MAG: bacterial transcriptional activator domain-containing protein [Anaerolineae bacterium]|nr:bacterial transcriptional activator domain-containing protein [Anaerolineae bacterium]
MIPQMITNLTIQEFQERSRGKKVILLYPWVNYRTIFLTHLIQNLDKGLLYYRIIGENPKLEEWLSSMATEFDQVLEGFGSHLKQALINPKPARLGEALAADLADYAKNENILLFIDEFDRAPLNGKFREFIEAAVKNLPDNIQLSFSSRRLTYEPWYNMVARGDACVVGTEYRKDDVMFEIDEPGRPQLEVYSLGRGYALVNGQMITNWDGALPRNLFFYFMDHPLVTRDEIFATFWPDLSVKEATNVFHVTKRKISERISMKVGDGKSYELTQYSGGFYMPSEKIVRHYDVADFQSAIERAMVAMSDEQEKTLLVEAIELYKAPFIQTVEMPWVVERRDQLRQLYAQALISMARLHKRRNELDHALGFFIRALKETPEREDIHREVMSIYLKQDMIEDAQRQYQSLEKILHDSLNIGPSRETRELYEVISAHS